MYIESGIENVGVAGRLARAIIGSFLIALVMVQSTPLGWLAVLPLVAVYPIFGAITGVDPILLGLKALAGKARARPKRPTSALPAH